jgi:hypothetical protein
VAVGSARSIPGLTVSSLISTGPEPFLARKDREHRNRTDPKGDDTPRGPHSLLGLFNIIREDSSLLSLAIRLTSHRCWIEAFSAMGTWANVATPSNTILF